MRMFICVDGVFFEKFIEFETIINIKNENPGALTSDRQ
jgi:hypothetical protein